MKKQFIYILFFMLLIIIATKNSTNLVQPTFIETANNYDFNNYEIEFIECQLTTDNFIDRFSYFYGKDFKILEIVPYINESYVDYFSDTQFLFYSNDLNDILDKFKNKYLDIMKHNDNYISNICIKKIKINTAYMYMKEFKASF